jgi:hypothetical protein
MPVSIQPKYALGYAETEQKLRSLALEIVKNIRDAPEILRQFGISEHEYGDLADTSVFKDMLRQAQAEWGGAGNTQERVKLKAAVLVEEALPDMYGQLTNKEEPLSSRVALLQTLSKLGGLGQQVLTPQGGTPGNVFRLEINFAGQKEKNIVIEQSAIPLMPPDFDAAEEAFKEIA